MYIFSILYEDEDFKVIKIDKFEFESTGPIRAHLSNGVGKLLFLGQCFATNCD